MKNDSTIPLGKKWLKWLLVAVGLEIVVLVAIVALVAFFLYWTRPQPSEVFENWETLCPWSGKARAWIDVNRNGIIDINEQPFDGVAFYLDLWSSSKSTYGSTTDETGWAYMVDGADCKDQHQAVYPLIPAGYELTTPARVIIDPYMHDQPMEFGFAYLPGVPTVTPFPPGPICRSYKLGRAKVYELTDLSVTPDGTVWVASDGDGAYALPPHGTDWVNYKKAGGLAGDRVRSITVESDASVWFATEAGASHFDGKTWMSYTTKDGLIDDDVSKIVVDGRLIWFATGGGVSMLDLDTKSWRSFTARAGLADDFVSYGAVSPNGSIWFSTLKGYSRLLWLYRPAGDPEWMTYNIDQGTHLEARPDGTIWVGGDYGLSIFDPQSVKWRSFDIPRQGLSLDAVNTLAFAPDGSLWIGSGRKNMIYHVLNGPSDNLELWHSYDSSDGLPIEINQDDKIEAIAFDPEGAVWIATRENATRCVFPGQ